MCFLNCVLLNWWCFLKTLNYWWWSCQPCEHCSRKSLACLKDAAQKWSKASESGPKSAVLGNWSHVFECRWRESGHLLTLQTSRTQHWCCRRTQEEQKGLGGWEVCEFTLSAESWQSCTASRNWYYKALHGGIKDFLKNNSISELIKILLGLIVLPALE